MVQVTFDTNNDSLAELEEALKILQAAVERRRGKGAAPAAKPALDIPVVETFDEPGPSDAPAAPAVKPAPQPAIEIVPEEEAAVDTPFFKITVGHGDKARPAEKAADAGGKATPTLSQLLADSSLTEDELAHMLKEGGIPDDELPAKKPKTKAVTDEQTGDAYIEIIEYTDEKQ